VLLLIGSRIHGRMIWRAPRLVIIIPSDCYSDRGTSDRVVQ